MTSTSKLVPVVVRQLRIIFCPRCKNSSGMRSFLNENLPTLKRTIAEESSKLKNSKSPANPAKNLPSISTVLMIRESKGAPPQVFLKMEGAGPELLLTFNDLNSRTIKSQLANFFPKLNVPHKEVKGRAGQPKPVPKGSARARANALEASKVAKVKASEFAKFLEPLTAKTGVLKGGKKNPGKNPVYLDRASFHVARKAGVKGRPAKNLDFKVVFGTSKTTPPSACNAFWEDGRQGPASWATTKLKGPKKSVFDESGISKRRLGLPKAACNAFWGAGRHGPSSWEVKKSKTDERASWSKIPKKKRNKKVRSCSEIKVGSKEPTFFPEPACNQFWGNGEKGPKSWTKPEMKTENQNTKISESSSGKAEDWFKWTLKKLSSILQMFKKG